MLFRTLTTKCDMRVFPDQESSTAALRLLIQLEW